MYNRWLVFKTTERTLREFLTQQLTLRDLILACNHEPMYLVDINDELQYAHIVQAPRSSDLPADYIPETDTYYDASLSVFHDEQATRELMIMVQRALQDVQAKLRMVEQVVAKSPEEIHAALSTS